MEVSKLLESLQGTPGTTFPAVVGAVVRNNPARTYRRTT